MDVVVGWVVSGAGFWFLVLFRFWFGCEEAVVNVMNLINGTVLMELTIQNTVLVSNKRSVCQYPRGDSRKGELLAVGLKKMEAKQSKG
jgi:hypothetical protein